MDDTKTAPSYWAVLPASVRYDVRLPASAKLLYAELSSLTESYGYCWANNNYFERLYGITERTVIRLLGKLEDAGYIRIEGGGTTKRKIWCGINPLAAADKNVSATDKNVSATDKNVSAIYNKKVEQKRGTDPPEAPQGASASKSIPSWNPERFEAFWRYYPAIPDGNGRGRRPAKDRAAKAWDRLRPDDATIAAMGTALRRQKESRQWREGIGIPYASTWLNGRKWEEEVEEIREQTAPAGRNAAEEAVEWV